MDLFLNHLCIAIEQRVPFISTISLLQDKGENIEVIPRQEMREKLLQNKDHFEIYEQNGMLVFLPCSIPPKTDEENLRPFDFKTDGRLKKISAEEALKLSGEKNKISDFVNLFSTEPKAKKILYISGHGGAGTHVAGLNESEYKQILKFSEDHCKGVIIQSCAAAGESAMLSVPNSPSTERASFLDQPKPHSCFIAVKSLGDFPTHANQAAEKDQRFT